MKNILSFVLFAGISLITISSAEQTPLSEEESNKAIIREKMAKIEEIVESEEYKKFYQEFKVPVYVSIDEQKEILKNSNNKGMAFLLTANESVEEMDERIKKRFKASIPIKEVQILYYNYYFRNPMIPESYMETMYDEKEYREKEERIQKALNTLDYPRMSKDELSQCALWSCSPDPILGYYLSAEGVFPSYKNDLLSLYQAIYPQVYYKRKLVFSYRGEPDIPPRSATPKLAYDSSISSRPQVYYGNFLEGGLANSKELEDLYEEVFLLIMKEELLMRSRPTFVPLSLLKEHAQQSGLEEYILMKNSKNSNEKKTYHQLAVEYYGSFDDWMVDVFRFLKEKYLTGQYEQD